MPVDSLTLRSATSPDAWLALAGLDPRRRQLRRGGQRAQMVAGRTAGARAAIFARAAGVEDSAPRLRIGTPYGRAHI